MDTSHNWEIILGYIGLPVIWQENFNKLTNISLSNLKILLNTK